VATVAQQNDVRPNSDAPDLLSLHALQFGVLGVGGFANGSVGHTNQDHGEQNNPGHDSPLRAASVFKWSYLGAIPERPIHRG
jgi:hypothetical protein